MLAHVRLHKRQQTHHAPKLPTPQAPTAQLAAAPTSAHLPAPPPPPISVPLRAVRLKTNRRHPTLTPATMPNRREYRAQGMLGRRCRSSRGRIVLAASRTEGLCAGAEPSRGAGGASPGAEALAGGEGKAGDDIWDLGGRRRRCGERGARGSEREREDVAVRSLGTSLVEDCQLVAKRQGGVGGLEKSSSPRDDGGTGGGDRRQRLKMRDSPQTRSGSSQWMDAITTPPDTRSRTTSRP